jgi:hypothetical protein
MSLKVYFDLMSQPSRALVIFLKAAKIKFDPKRVDIKKGTDQMIIHNIEHRGTKY